MDNIARNLVSAKPDAADTHVPKSNEGATKSTPLTSFKDLLLEIGVRAHGHAIALAAAEHVRVVRSAASDWDGETMASFWWSGKKDTFDGELFAGPWEDFGKMLADYTMELVGKGEGVWFTPAVTTNGRCRDIDISAITQLALDADNVGEWDVMRTLLEGAGLAHVVQRSSSHTPERVKWHVHIPLVLHWSGAKEEWRRIYRHCVGWFSAAAQLTCDLNAKPPMFGFDKTTDRLGQPWFPAGRRSEDATPAETICRSGLALDLEHFLNITGFDWSEPSSKVVRVPRSKTPKKHGKGMIKNVPSGVVTGVPSFLLALAFREAGMLGQPLGEGKWAVVCPWERAHTTGTPLDSSTIIFAPNKKRGPGWFHCRHGHCEGRTPHEVLTALPPAAVGAAMAIERNLRHASVTLTNGGAR